MSKRGGILYEWFTLLILTVSIASRKHERFTRSWWQNQLAILKIQLEVHQEKCLQAIKDDGLNIYQWCIVWQKHILTFLGKVWGSGIWAFWTSASVLYHTSSTMGQIVLKQRLTWVPNRSSVLNTAHLPVREKIKFTSTQL